MNFDEYRSYDATGLAALAKTGDVKATELLELAINRSQAVKNINAIITPMFTLAQERANQPLEGIFAGVPFLIKDLMQDYANVPCAMGNQALKQKQFTPVAHSEIVNRWLKAGVVIFGKTNTPEFGTKGITEPEAWGATQNPWNIQHTPGGSSGGSAAAVAAGIVPMAGANDGGGSIRIPAACCGLFGFKPGRGRTPTGPELGEGLHGAISNHVITRSVRDSAAMLDACVGYETPSLFHIKPHEESYSRAIETPPKPLRIAMVCASPLGTPIHPEAQLATEKTAKLLTSLGHTIEEARLPFDGLQQAKDFLTIWFANCALTVAQIKQQTGASNNGFELDTIALAEIGKQISSVEYAAAYQRWLVYTREMAQFFQQYDALMTPTLAAPPAKIGEIATPPWQKALIKTVLTLRGAKLLLKSGIVDLIAKENLRWVPFTQLANQTGMPAMSVPLHWCQNGLPLGVQFMGPHSSEALLLQLAAQLEQAQPWFNKVAPL